MRNYGYQFLKYVQSYGCHLKKHAELWAPFWRNALCLVKLWAWFAPALCNYGSFFKHGRNYWFKFGIIMARTHQELGLVALPLEYSLVHRSSLLQASNSMCMHGCRLIGCKFHGVSSFQLIGSILVGLQ